MRQSFKTYLKVILNLVTALAILLLCIFLVPKCIVFFMPFIVGWLISLIAAPVVRFFEEKFKVKRKAVSAIVIIAVIAVVVLAVYLIGAKLVKEGIGFINEVPKLWEIVLDEFNQVGKSLEVLYVKLPGDVQDKIQKITSEMGTYFEGIIGNISAPTFEAVGNVAKQIPDIIMAVIICLLSAYFFVADKGYMAQVAEKYVPASIRYNFELIKRSFRKAIGGYFKAQFKIECWIYLLLVIGLLILNVKYALLVGLGIAFLDFLPVFGTGTVMIPWAVIAFLGKDYRMTFGLVIIWLVGQLVRQIIQPKIVGDSIGVDAIPTLFLLYIGYKIGGVVGMIFAVPIGIIIANLYEEGVFETTRQSVKILVAGFNRFRRIRPEDMAIVTDYEREVKDTYQQELSQEDSEIEQLEEASQLKIEEPPIIKKFMSKKEDWDRNKKEDRKK